MLGKELGKFTRDKSGAFYQNDRAIITSAVGHLLEQKKPMTEEGKSLPWKFDYLPVIPLFGISRQRRRIGTAAFRFAAAVFYMSSVIPHKF